MLVDLSREDDGLLALSHNFVFMFPFGLPLAAAAAACHATGAVGRNTFVHGASPPDSSSGQNSWGRKTSMVRCIRKILSEPEIHKVKSN